MNKESPFCEINFNFNFNLFVIFSVFSRYIVSEFSQQTWYTVINELLHRGIESRANYIAFFLPLLNFFMPP